MDERKTEQALLGALLKKTTNIGNVSEIVESVDFTWKPYRDVYDAMVHINNQGLGVDTITIGDTLDKQGLLTDFALHDLPNTAGRSALVLLREESVSENASTYAQIVKNYAQNRKILEIMNQGAGWVAKGRNPSDILKDITQEMNAIDTSAINTKTVTISQAISAAWDITDKANKGEASYIKTHFTALDKLIIGFSAPDFTIVAARPGVGKTAFLASIVHNIMRHERKVIVYFTLEMGSEQVAMRFISMESGINFHKQRSGFTQDSDYTKYTEAVGELTAGNYPLYINDISAISPKKIRQELRRIGHVDLVIVDYIQLATSDEKAERRNLEVASISRTLKKMAGEFHVPVICAAQLNRQLTQRAKNDQLPQLTDLAESGALEQDADNVIFLHRIDNSSDAEVLVAKQRNGPTGYFHLTYLGEKTRFENQAGIR